MAIEYKESVGGRYGKNNNSRNLNQRDYLY